MSGQVNNDTLFEGSTVVRVKMPEDVNMDGKVDTQGLLIEIKAFNSFQESPRWNRATDENEDGRIDMRDIVLVVMNFGKNTRNENSGRAYFQGTALRNIETRTKDRLDLNPFRWESGRD